MKLKLITAVISITGFLALIVAFAVSSRGSGTPPSKTSSPEDDPVTVIYVPGVAGGISEISAANNAVFGTAPWAHGSNGGIGITPDGSTMYVSNHETSSVTVFDTATNVPIMEIGVGLNHIGLAIT